MSAPEYKASVGSDPQLKGLLFWKRLNEIVKISFHDIMQMNDAEVEQAARHFAILSEPARLMLLRSLMEGPHTVTELITATGMKQGNVSKHLGVLLQARFVAKEKDGTFSRYSLSDSFIYPLCELMCKRIHADAQAQLETLEAHPA